MVMGWALLYLLLNQPAISLKQLGLDPYPRVVFFFFFLKCEILEIIKPCLKAIIGVKFYDHLSLTDLYQFRIWKLGFFGMEDKEKERQFRIWEPKCRC